MQFFTVGRATANERRVWHHICWPAHGPDPGSRHPQTPKFSWLSFCVVGLGQVPLGNSGVEGLLSCDRVHVSSVCLGGHHLHLLGGKERKQQWAFVLALIYHGSSWAQTQVRYFSQWLVPGTCAGRSVDSTAMSIAYASLADSQRIIDAVYRVPNKSQHWAQHSERSCLT